MKRAAAALIAAIVLLASVAFAAAGKVNVNAASAAEMTQVAGLDANIAVRIVARRTAQGPFHKLDELLEVQGFTKMMMISAADHLEIGPAGPVAAAPMGSAAANGGKKLDLNKASFKDLLLLPEMTPRGAKSIMDYRESAHGFSSIDELERVPGLDKRLIVQLLDQVEVTGARPAATAAPAQTAVAVAPTATPQGDTATLGEGGWNGSWVSKIEATPTPQPQETAKPLASGEKIDLNNADREELERLPDIGQVFSQRILDYRTKNGPFKTVDGLLQVRGIGAQRFAAIRPYVTVGGKVATLAPKATPTPRPKSTQVAVAETPRPKATPAEIPKATPKPIAKTGSGKAILADGRVNINVAGIEDLLTLPRMTREAAGEIVAFRAKNGPFHDPHGITDVPSIGEATYARIREKIAISE